MLSNTASSAAGTAGAVLGLQAVLPGPSPPQDFKNANLVSPKFQDTHALINGNFDAGSTWMVILVTVGAMGILGLACWCARCRKWIPTVEEKRQEIRQENSAMDKQEARLQEWLTVNPWSKVEQGLHPQWAAVPPRPRNWDQDEGLDSLKRSVERSRARQGEEWRQDRRKEWEKEREKEEVGSKGGEEEDEKGGGKRWP